MRIETNENWDKIELKHELAYVIGLFYYSLPVFIKKPKTPKYSSKIHIFVLVATPNIQISKWNLTKTSDLKIPANEISPHS